MWVFFSDHFLNLLVISSGFFFTEVWLLNVLRQINAILFSYYFILRRYFNFFNLVCVSQKEIILLIFLTIFIDAQLQCLLA